MNKEVDLSVSCLGKVKELKYDVIILPWGATEPHNLHLPYLTDCILPMILPWRQPNWHLAVRVSAAW